MIQSTHLTPISRITLGEEIVQRLISYILEQRLKPGDKLPTERDLMAQLSVGRSSLREAIKTLSAIGVVRVVVREGMFVGGGDSSVLSKPLSWALLLGEQSTREVIEARRAIEVELASLAAQRASAEDIAAIEACLEEMRAALGDGAAFARCDLKFHVAVARAAGNQILYHMLETLRNIVQAWIEKVVFDNQGHPRSFEEHVPLVEAIRAHDQAAARSAMATHLNAAASRLLSTVGPPEDGNRSRPSRRAASAVAG